MIWNFILFYFILKMVFRYKWHFQWYWIKYLATGIEEYKIPQSTIVDLDLVSDASCPVCLTTGRCGRLISFICKFAGLAFDDITFYSSVWTGAMCVCMWQINKCRKNHKKDNEFCSLVDSYLKHHGFGNLFEKELYVLEFVLSYGFVFICVFTMSNMFFNNFRYRFDLSTLEEMNFCEEHWINLKF